MINESWRGGNNGVICNIMAVIVIIIIISNASCSCMCTMFALHAKCIDAPTTLSNNNNNTTVFHLIKQIRWKLIVHNSIFIHGMDHFYRARTHERESEPDTNTYRTIIIYYVPNLCRHRRAKTIICNSRHYLRCASVCGVCARN